jgi:hypothetical protein
VYSDQKQKILDAVAQALDAVGMDTGGDEYGELAETNSVPIWSQIDVSVPDAGRGPIHDKSALFNAAKEARAIQTDAYGMPLPGEHEFGMTALGMV